MNEIHERTNELGKRKGNVKKVTLDEQENQNERKGRKTIDIRQERKWISI